MVVEHKRFVRANYATVWFLPPSAKAFSNSCLPPQIQFSQQMNWTIGGMAKSPKTSMADSNR
jgi:hypothetical protein